MDREAELEIVRRAYAKRVMFAAGVHDRRVEAAFAPVSREHFLGRGPWSILRWNHGYLPTPSRNPMPGQSTIPAASDPPRQWERISD